LPRHRTKLVRTMFARLSYFSLKRRDVGRDNSCRLCVWTRNNAEGDGAYMVQWNIEQAIAAGSIILYTFAAVYLNTILILSSRARISIVISLPWSWSSRRKSVQPRVGDEEEKKKTNKQKRPQVEQINDVSKRRRLSARRPRLGKTLRAPHHAQSAHDCNSFGGRVLLFNGTRTTDRRRRLSACRKRLHVRIVYLPIYYNNIARVIDYARNIYNRRFYNI